MLIIKSQPFSHYDFSETTLGKMASEGQQHADNLMSKVMVFRFRIHNSQSLEIAKIYTTPTKPAQACWGVAQDQVI